MSKLPGVDLASLDVHSVPLPRPGYVGDAQFQPLPGHALGIPDLSQPRIETSTGRYESKCRRLIQKPRLDRPLTPVTHDKLAASYGFPTLTSLSSQWASFLSLGGGTSMADVNGFCQHFGYPVPPVRFVSVKGATNDYTGNPDSADGENALDVQTIIGLTKGKVGILIYGAPNSDDGFCSAAEQCANDNSACVESCSWGSIEQGTNTRMSAAILALKKLGIPFPAASGDAGSGDGGTGNNADYPSSDPNALGVGGTSLAAAMEAAWSFGGGGPSRLYPKPTWQSGVPGSMRGVPDVAGDADPNSGLPTLINGQWGTFGGTSMAAPTWAAAVALIVSITGKRIYNLAETIYANDLLTDIISGSNGAFTAVPGYDYCTGRGVPSKKFFDFMVAGAVNPPPVLPPPVVPPPVVPPPVTPPPVSTMPTKDQADALFAALEAKFASRPMLLQRVKFTHHAADVLYAKGAVALEELAELFDLL